MNFKLSVLIFLFKLSLFTTISFSQSTSPLLTDKLTCEYIPNPLGIDTKSPRLSWTLTSKERNQFQTAYEIIVSDNLNDINHNIGNIWSTGKISSSQNLHIQYAGKELQSFTKYYWRVKVFDQDNKTSAWCKPAWFETTMLRASDWKAAWINDGSLNPKNDVDYYKDDRMPLLRKQFTIKKKIGSVRLYVSGLGYYEAYLNGQKIGDHVLDPGFTTYRKEVLYAVYDITSLIKNGTNTAGVMLGSGWWNPLPFKFFGRWDLRNYQQTGRPCVKAEIHVTYTDGSKEKIITDESWQTAPGPIIRNNVFLGETYDARLEQGNWNSAIGNTSLWENATVVEGPSGELKSQMQPAIKITTVLKPVKITEPKPDTFLVDMGQNFAGVAKINVQAPAGTKITLRYGEDLYKDGTLNFMTSVATQIKKGGIKGGPGAPETAWQEDVYITKGSGREMWSPRFTFHGFRYVEITGWPGKPTLNDVEGLRMNSALPQTGSFECSNEMFTQLHKVIQWTFLSNVFSVQSDCPGREKMGYGADMVVSSNAFLYNYDMANFYSKAVRDFANEQQADGGITEIAPYTGIADRGYGGESGPLGWELGFPYLQKQLYDFYGDKKIIADNYDAFARQITFLQSKAVDGLFHWDISDHEALDPKPEAFTAAAFYYHHVLLATEFAGILGKTTDSIKYDRLARQIKNAITRKYLVPTTGRFDNATQSAQLFALWYGLSPEKNKTFDVLLEEFARHGWHISTGIFSTKMLFDVLRENNRNDVAFRVANQRDYPGWGNMLVNGATTLWETWKYPESGPSQNHPMFGSIDEWFYRSLLGINSAAPGFKKIIIKPQPVKEITWAKGSYESAYGTISSDWSTTGKDFILKVSIPANTTAEIWLPAKENKSMTESEKAVTATRYENGYALVNVGSGVYSFKVDQ